MELIVVLLLAALAVLAVAVIGYKRVISLDTFFPNANSSQYWQPRSLDMSDYTVARTGGGIQLSREMTLHLARPNRDIDLRLTKWFGPRGQSIAA